MNTKEKIIIVLLAVYFLAAIVCCIVLRNGVIMWARELFSGSAIGAILLGCGLWYRFTILNHREFSPATPTGEKPGFLGSFMGIGQHLIGSFRKVEGTQVAYTFFSVILPIIPTGCYRVKLLSSEGGGSFHQSKWIIYGKEESMWDEVLNIYLTYYGGLIWALCMVFAIVLMIVR